MADPRSWGSGRRTGWKCGGAVAALFRLPDPGVWTGLQLTPFNRFGQHVSWTATFPVDCGDVGLLTTSHLTVRNPLRGRYWADSVVRSRVLPGKVLKKPLLVLEGAAGILLWRSSSSSSLRPSLQSSFSRCPNRVLREKAPVACALALSQGIRPVPEPFSGKIPLDFVPLSA